MKFETALSLMRKHIKMRKPFWKPTEYIWVRWNGLAIVTEERKRYDVGAIELLEEDWERYEEVRK
jgi:hypothetical protein